MILEIVNTNGSWVPNHTGELAVNHLTDSTKKWIDDLILHFSQLDLSIGMTIEYKNQFNSDLKLRLVSIQSEPCDADIGGLAKDMDNLDIDTRIIKINLSQEIQEHPSSVYKEQEEKLLDRLGLYFNFPHLGIKQKRTFILRGRRMCGKDFLVNRVSFKLQKPVIYFNIHQESAHLSYYSKSTATPAQSPLSKIIDLVQLTGPCILLINGMEVFDGEIKWKDFDTTDILESFFSNMQRLRDFKVIIIACCSESAKLPKHFADYDEIELPLLDYNGRYSILQSYNMNDTVKKQLANAMVGYSVGEIDLLIERVLFEHRKSNLQIGNATFEMFYAYLRTNKASDEFQTAKKDTKWSEIGGYSEIKAKLQRLVTWPIESPQIYERSQIYSKYLGDSEFQIRKIFQAAKNSSPCILFIDDLDTVASRREWSEDGTGGVNERVLSSLLNEMDGISGLKGVLVVGCTNRPHQLDDALTRPGRLDFHYYVTLPSSLDRKEIIELYSTKCRCNLSDDQVNHLVEITENYTPSDIQVMFREAGMIALTDNFNSDQVSYENVLTALSNVLSVDNPSGNWLPGTTSDLKSFKVFAGRNKNS
ncbi:spermatogenesis associated protein 5 [Boothiomyces sp. JEL0866]|nr:spermatogenesis associated protein 5 [Boothiomyces sp. JEL0866]